MQLEAELKEKIQELQTLFKTGEKQNPVLKFIQQGYISPLKFVIFNDKKELNLLQLFKSDYSQLVNIGDISGLEIQLKDIQLNDISTDELKQYVMEIWKNDIFSNQKWAILCKMPLIKNVNNLASGVFGVVYQPIKSIVGGENVVAGSIQGVKGLVSAIGQEGLNLTQNLTGAIGGIFGLSQQANSMIFNKFRQ